MINAYSPFALMPACAGFGGQAKGDQKIRRGAIAPRAGAQQPCNRVAAFIYLSFFQVNRAQLPV